MLVLFTLAFAAILSVMGMAVDFGFVALERRTLQKAADAAAMSGALDLVDSSTRGSISADVATMVTRNGVGAGTTTNCTLVNNSNTQVQANCGTPTNNTTSGVSVTLTRTRNNFFMGLLGQSTVNVSATGIGRVVLTNSYDAGNGPFIVCGYNTFRSAGGTQSILAPGGPPYTVLDAAVGQTFEIHGPHVATCGAGNEAFKGLADMDANEGITTLPNILYSDNGVKAGPTRALVDGPDGCGVAEDDNCVMVLPVATWITGPPQRQAGAVMWLPFLVTQAGANQHNGQLISKSYLLRRTTTATSAWTLNSSGLVSARLVR